MTYKEKYFEIINNGYKTKPDNVYTEKHHIAPKSICTILKKAQANLVYLTAQNHFLAHYYIWKWFRDELHEKKWTKKMCYAFNMMKRIITKCEDIEELSKLYEEVRKDFNETNKGNNHPFYGKHHTKESRMKMSEARKGQMTGKKLQEKTKMKISEGNKGKIVSEETRRKLSEANSKPVLQYTKDGIFIREWKSARDVERNLGYSQGHISECCQGKLKSAYNFVWKYKEEKTEN